MAATHLSELCRGSDIDAIAARLRQSAPVDEPQGTNDIDPAASPSPNQANRQGLWGYQDADGRTALHWAIALKNFELARKLMNPPYNSPVLTEDEEWTTPFATACSVGAPLELVTELLDKSVAEFAEYAQWKASNGCAAPANGKAEANHIQDVPVNPTADAKNPAPGVRNAVPGVVIPSPVTAESAASAVLEAEDSTGLTPLLIAAGRGHSNIVRFLIDKGANINHQNARGQTALHRAVNRGNMDLVEYLVSVSLKQNGTNRAAHRRFLDLQDFHGDSALFYASMDNNEEMGRLLLRSGADRELRNKAGKNFWEV